MVATVPHYALEQARDSARGGEGWRSSEGMTAAELTPIWSPWGVTSECGTLSAMLMRRPGPEIDGITDAAGALWHDVIDPTRAPYQHDLLAGLYRSNEVAVDKPSSYFYRDVFGAPTNCSNCAISVFLGVLDAGEARRGLAINVVPLAQGLGVMPAGNPVTRDTLEATRVTCLEVEVDELMKGAGSVHYMTGVVHREAV